MHEPSQEPPMVSNPLLMANMFLWQARSFPSNTKDPSIVLAAVHQNPAAILFASQSLVDQQDFLKLVSSTRRRIPSNVHRGFVISCAFQYYHPAIFTILWTTQGKFLFSSTSDQSLSWMWSAKLKLRIDAIKCSKGHVLQHLSLGSQAFEVTSLGACHVTMQGRSPPDLPQNKVF